MHASSNVLPEHDRQQGDQKRGFDLNLLESAEESSNRDSGDPARGLDDTRHRRDMMRKGWADRSIVVVIVVCVYACVCACVRACVSACVRACVRACVHACMRA